MQHDDTEWMTAAQAYLARLGRGEYEAQISTHNRSKKKFKFIPSQYMLDLIERMNKNDEEGFKSLKMLEGYSSDIKV